jgi:hypothetical protein
MAGVGQKTQNPVSSLINWLMPGNFPRPASLKISETGFAGLRPPPSSPAKPRWFPGLRRHSRVQWLERIKIRSALEILFLAPVLRPEATASLYRQNSVSQTD